MFFDLMYCEFVLTIKPYEQRNVMYMEIVNECLLALMFYHMVLFSLFTTNDMTKYEFGNSFISVIGILMGVNIAFAVYSSVSDIRKRKRKEALKKIYDERMEYLKLNPPQLTKE